MAKLSRIYVLKAVYHPVNMIISSVLRIVTSKPGQKPSEAFFFFKEIVLIFMHKKYRHVKNDPTSAIKVGDEIIKVPNFV